ncbi:DUF1963 domain-containing protein [Corynebacterium glaucum]|uniref:DUF1963 domain-containing protein n=1 Tax=Corynebacterium glaucum TaxID=187491 RepID=UPI0025B45B28|nr:DUF1963 domain-containing protein [Corynebacterium glaucum]WJZ07015.1 hypothetical protein CGLAUT_02545 [Corynebacterium glaucum]
MFESREQAIELAHEMLPEEIIPQVVDLFVPCIGLEPTGEVGANTLGGTRIGGNPDVPEGFEWPQLQFEESDIGGRPIPDLDVENALRSPSVPFIAQVNLAEAHALGAVSADLPAEGRLLFFWDYRIAPWLPVRSAARVIHDTTPVDQLQEATLPDDLRREHEAELQEYLKNFGEPGDLSAFFVPAVGARLYEGITLPPSIHQPELDPPELKNGFAKFREAGFADEVSDYLWEGNPPLADPEWRKYQLLGVPNPVQSGPRYELKEFADLSEVEADPTKWRLLFQFAFEDWNYRIGDWETYFLIRNEALARGDFSDVRTVTQNT